MAEALASISAQMTLRATLSQSIDGGNQSAQCTQGFAKSWSLTTGTAVDKADRVWCDESRALSSGSSENLDLYDLASFDIGAGAGKTALGQSLALVEIVGICWVNLSTSSGSLVVGGEGSGATWNSLFAGSDTATLTFPPGGGALFVCPYDPAWLVADSTNHLLKFAASGGAVTYSVAFLGRSA